MNRKAKSLDLKYRPTNFKTLIGQEHAVVALETVLEDESKNSFLFSGPSGCGKTTTARIIARHLRSTDVTEIDAATNTGVDDMRFVTQLSKQSSLSGGVKVIIIDECHLLSKNAWSSMLKSIEEPNVFTYWVLCTTQLQKVPREIKTRCVCIDFKPVGVKDLMRLLSHVNSKEGYGVSSDILRVVANHAEGSPRLALGCLSQIRLCETKQEAEKILEQSVNRSEIVDFCRLLFKSQFNPGKSWSELMGYLDMLKDKGESAESVRIAVFNYFGSVAKNNKKEDQVAFGLSVMDSFSSFIEPSEGYNRLVLNVGSLLFRE